MTNLASLMTIITLLLPAALPAEAQPFGGGRTPLSQIDTNGDRALQFTEIEAMRAKMFARADTDADGVLNSAEIAALQARAAARARPGGDRIAALDTDGDGVIAQGEFVAVPARMRAADVDGNGALTPNELMTLRR